MKNSISIVSLIAFVFSILIFMGLDFISEDYNFEPVSNLTPEENINSNNLENISQEIIRKYSRISGIDENEDVKINVIFLNPIQKLGYHHLNFQITLYSQRIDLSGYRITKNVLIEDSTGLKIKKGFTWQEIHNHNGYHIIGVLSLPYGKYFSKNRKSGRESKNIEPSLKWVKLIIQGIPNTDLKEFRWDLEL